MERSLIAGSRCFLPVLLASFPGCALQAEVRNEIIHKPVSFYTKNYFRNKGNALSVTRVD